MSRENMIWLVVFVIGAAALLGRALFTEQGMSKSYVHAVEVDRVNIGDAQNPSWVSVEEARNVNADVPAPNSENRKSWTRFEQAG